MINRFPDELDTSQLDSFFQIASFVDSKLPKPKELCKNAPSMYDLLTIKPDEMDHSYHEKPKMTLRLNPFQVAVYEFVISILLKLHKKDREIIQLRNFPHKISFNDLKKFYMPISKEGIRLKYHNAVYECCRTANRIGIKKLLKGQ